VSTAVRATLASVTISSARAAAAATSEADSCSCLQLHLISRCAGIGENGLGFLTHCRRSSRGRGLDFFGTAPGCCDDVIAGLTHRPLCRYEILGFQLGAQRYRPRLFGLGGKGGHSLPHLVRFLTRLGDHLGGALLRFFLCVGLDLPGFFASSFQEGRGLMRR
jgi:hypothetical protein